MEQIKANEIMAEIVCQVCRSQRFDEGTFTKITCNICKRVTHQLCYAPDISDPKEFICDECSTWQEEACCYFCQSNSGMLKKLGANAWTHVFCALTSPTIIMSSYKSLSFGLSPAADVACHKKSCYICKKKTTHAFKCWAKCHSYMHVACVVNQRQGYFIFGLLDKHTRLLMCHLRHQSERFPSFKLLSPRRIKPAICGNHSNEPHFIFCTCNKSKEQEIKNKVTKYIECRKCKRWFHSICTCVEDSQEDDFECSGCQENNFFEKAVHLCEMVEKMIEIQDSGKLDKVAIKVLDSCTFGMSERILEICLKEESVEQINRYFCLKALLNIFVGQIYNYAKIYKTNEKQILQILHLMTKGYPTTHEQIDQKVKGQIIQLLQEHKEQLDVQDDVFATIHFHLKRFQFMFRERESSRISKKQEIDTAQAQKLFEILSRYRQNRIQNSPQDLENIIAQTIQTISILKKNELADYFQRQFRDQNIIFDIFFCSNMSLQQYRATINKLARIQQLRKGKIIKESQYNQMMNCLCQEFECFDSEKKLELQMLYQQRMKDFKIIFNCQNQQQQQHQYQDHQILLNKAIQKIKMNLMFRQNCLISKELVGNLLYLAAEDSEQCLTDYSLIYCLIKTKKNQRNILTPIQEQIKEFMDQIKNYLRNPKSYKDLREQQREQVNKFLSKSRFYLKIMNYQAKSQGIDYRKYQDDRKEMWFDEICELGGLKYLQSLAFDAMIHWKNSLEPMHFALKKLSELCQAQVRFSAEQKQAISNFVKKVIQYLFQNEPCLQKPGALQPHILLDLARIIRSFQYEQHFIEFLEIERVYSAWAQDFQQFKNIYQVLEKRDHLKRLITLIDYKIITAKDIKVVDLSVQLRKLKVIKIWASISERVLVDARGIRFNMNSIYELESIMKQSRYPANQLRLTIQRWSHQARGIEQKLNFFKPKVQNVQQILQMHEQLAMLQNKRQVEEAQKLIQQMKNSQVQFIYQIIDLQKQVQKFREIAPSDLKQWAEQHTYSAQIQKMRKFILQSRFSIGNIEDYVYFYRKMQEVKCREFQGRANRKELYRMLHHGGKASLSVIQKTPKLISTYELIDKAKNEILKLQPNPDNLLPEDYSLIRQDIEIDSVESKNVLGFYQNALVLDQRLTKLRKTRAEWQKYVQLMAEITRQPVRLQKLGLQIADLRNKLDECIKEMQKIKQKGDYNNPKCDSLVQKYKKIGIKSQQMELFSALIVRFREIITLGSSMSRSDYERFSKMSEQYPQLSKNPSIRQIRQTSFYKVSQSYLETKQILNELGQALIRQGGQIIKKTTNTQQVLGKLNSITKKLTADRKNQTTKPNEQLKEREQMLTSEEQQREKFGRTVPQSQSRRLETEKNKEAKP